MKKNSNENNIVKFDKGFQFNIGAFLLFIIVLYVAFHIYSSATKKDVTAYEVTLGRIVDKNFFTGMAIRDEEIVTSDKAGDIYYYEKNKSRVGVKSKLYAIDTKGNTINQIKSWTEEQVSLSNEDLKDLSLNLESFLGNFDPVHFQNIYSFETDVEDYLSDIMVEDVEETYANEISSAMASGAYIDYYATKPGFLVYTIDGYENKTSENFTSEDFNSGGITIQNLRTNNQVEAGGAVYKLINSEEWKLIIPVDEQKYEELLEYNIIEVLFTQDNAKTWANAELLEKSDGKYLVLSFDDSMERYASQRFINVELLLDEKQGLKIPNSAICQKDFYVVPKTFFFAGGNSNENGVLVRNEEGEDRFIIPTIYYETEGAYYIDNEQIKAGDKLIKESSTDYYTVGADIDTLTGVYNINKGYTVFKVIEEIYKNEDYTIVKNQANYSIALFDHIVLDSSIVSENEIL